MTNKTKILIGVGAVAAVAVAAVVFKVVQPKIAPDNAIDGNGGTDNQGSQIVRPPSTNETVNLGRTETGKIGFPLNIGDKGVGVSYLQKALQCLGYYKGTIDGKFGAETYKALNDYMPISRIACRITYGCYLDEFNWKKVVREAKQKCGTDIFFVSDEIWEQYTDLHTNYWSKKRQEL
jgi:hypothetical protein